MERTLLALSACIALPASAAWTLDSDASSLNFLSTKNAQVTEVHSFDELKGSLSDSGKLTGEVPLDCSSGGSPPISCSRFSSRSHAWLVALLGILLPCRGIQNTC